MAHNLAVISGQDAIAYLDQTPWHGLGQKLQLAGVPPAERIQAAMQAASLDYTVGSLPLQLPDGTPVLSHKASVRFERDGVGMAAQLGVVGTGYQHVQNVDACGILRPLAEEFGAVPAAMGALGNGERCWALMRLADAQVSPLPGDDVRGYFLLHWSHDGQTGVTGMGTPIRVVCQNTLNMATAGNRKAWISIRHTSSADARLDQAAKLVRELAKTMQTTGETFATMARRNLSAAELDAYIAQVIPNTDPKAATLSPVIVARRDTVARLVFLGRGAAMANQGANTAAGEASLWAAYNGVTEYVDHVRTAEAQSPAGLKRAQESAIFGQNAEIKAGALQLARQLVAA